MLLRLPLLLRILTAAVALCAMPAVAEEPPESGGNAAPTPAKAEKAAAPAPEPLCGVVQPALLKSGPARAFAGSRLTWLAPAAEGEFGLTCLSDEKFEALGISWEAFLLEATAAANRLVVSLEPEFVKDDDGRIAHAVLRSNRHHLPSVVLSPGFLEMFRKPLGDRLVVVIPNHFTVYVFSRNDGHYRSFGPRALEEYSRSLWPCSEEFFEVTADGVRCLGAFDRGDSPAAGRP